jgi:hypothetical protein
VSLALCTSAQAQNPLQISDKRLALSIRLDDAREASQRVQGLDGVPAMIFLAEPRQVRERHYIPTPAGVIPQEMTVVQGASAALEVTPRVLGDQVSVQVGRQPATRSGRLGEWFELGQVALSAGGETRRLWIKVDEQP